jgi:hypothetical protein
MSSYRSGQSDNNHGLVHGQDNESLLARQLPCDYPGSGCLTWGALDYGR